MPASPSLSEPSEPPAEDVAGEVLLCDAGRSTLPELSEIGHHKVPERRRQGQAGHEPVEDCLCGWLVEGVEGPPEGADSSLAVARAR